MVARTVKIAQPGGKQALPSSPRMHASGRREAGQSGSEGRRLDVPAQPDQLPLDAHSAFTPACRIKSLYRFWSLRISSRNSAWVPG